MLSLLYSGGKVWVLEIKKGSLVHYQPLKKMMPSCQKPFGSFFLAKMLQSFRLWLHLFICYTLMPSQQSKVRPLLNGISSNIHISASDVSPESPSMDITCRLEIFYKMWELNTQHVHSPKHKWETLAFDHVRLCVFSVRWSFDSLELTRNGLSKLPRLGKDHLCFAVTISMCAFNNFF